MGRQTATSLSRKLNEVYRLLHEHYGPQHWWPGETPFEVIVGAILTQSAAWVNVEKAIASLQSRGLLDAAALLRIPQDELAGLIYSSGYYNAKAKKLKAFVQRLEERYHGSLAELFALDTVELREELLSIYGVGEETADSIILYAAGKPIFVIDAYTRRIVDRLGLGPSEPRYASYQALFMEHLPREARLFNEFHALLVQQGKLVCQKKPLCSSCCLRGVCRMRLRVSGKGTVASSQENDNSL